MLFLAYLQDHLQVTRSFVRLLIRYAVTSIENYKLSLSIISVCNILYPTCPSNHIILGGILA